MFRLRISDFAPFSVLALSTTASPVRRSVIRLHHTCIRLNRSDKGNNPVCTDWQRDGKAGCYFCLSRCPRLSGEKR